MNARRILVVEHESDSGAAMLAERAMQRGFHLNVVTPKTGIPRNAENHEMVLTMGSAASVNDADVQHWFQDEIALLCDADQRKIPILGVCFGAQALAVALGGSVTRSSKPEIGWFEVQTNEPDLIARGPWFEWHVDAITPPVNAQVLATTEVCVQAYTVRNHLAVQFHPEVTDREIGSWAAAESETLRGLGIDSLAMLHQTRTALPEARKRAYDLFDRFLDRVALS